MILKKSYIVFDLDGRPSRDANSIKRLYQANDCTWIGHQKSACFMFSANRVIVFGPVGAGCSLSFGDVDGIVSSAKGVPVLGKVVLQIYHARLPMVRCKAQQAVLHSKIAAAPPKGLLTNTLDFQASNNLVLKLSPYRDGFKFVVQVDSDGLVAVLCDARACDKPPCADAFRRRCAAVLLSLKKILE